MSCECCERASLALNVGQFPFQGNDRSKHRCVFCGVALFKPSHYLDFVTPNDKPVGFDNVFCGRLESIAPVTRGFLWWKKVNLEPVNVGCSGSPHLHRRCWSCDARWHERTSSQEQFLTELSKKDEKDE